MNLGTEFQKAHQKMPVTCKMKLLFLLVALCLLFRFTKSVPSSECRTVVDLCLVIDGSDSISKGDYEKQRDATANLMTNLDIGDNRARVGIVVFSTTIAEEVPLSSDKELLNKRAQSLPHPRDGTNTALAIKTMRAMFQSYGRPDTPRIGIVITDGISKDPKLTMEEAQKAREEGISLIAVGVTSLIDSNELLNIAGVDSRVLKLESFDELKGALALLAKTICPCDTPPVITHTVISPGPRTVGTVRFYECLEGYRGLGSGQIACLENSTWTIPTLECVACPEPPLITNAVVDPGDNLIKTLRNFRCNPGYIPSGPTVIECLPDTTWSIPQFECIICGDTPIVPHSIILPGPHLIDSVRNYECEKGYIPVGPTNIKCKTDATWSPPEFQCVACMDPPVVPNAVVDVGSNLIGALRNYQCVKGFLAKGKTSIVCQSDATWSPPEFICDVCGETPVVPNAVITKGDHFIGSVRVYQCDKGFLATGPTEIICQEDGLWSKPSIQCIACLDPPLVQHALLEPGSNLIGSLRNYICEKGFVATGPTTVECLPNAAWAPQQFMCVACTDPPLVSNSVVDIGSNLIGSVRTYTCKDGFVAKGKTSIVCQPDAHWSPPEFICDACMDPPVVPNAVVDVGSNLIGALRNYQCVKGFLAKGKTSIVCQSDATWSPPEFICDVCGETPVVPNAVITKGDHFIGSVRVYQCDKGFLATGPTEIICQEDGLWSKPSIQCIACLDPPLVQHALLEPGSNLIGSLRNYICEKGFVATGPTTVECLPNAAWAPQQFMCVACTDPPLVSSSVVDIGSNLIGSVRTYTCKDGFVAKGKTSIVCQPDAHWSPPEFICDVCPETPIVLYAVIGPGDHFIGSLRVYQCEKGFRATAPTEIVCQKDGTWSQPAFQCVACPEPPLVKNALIEPGSNLIGSVRQYVCEDGFLASGPTAIECSPDGGWTLPQFSCIVCGDTPLIPNAKIRPGPYLIGTVRTYDCVEGYKASGPTDILCLKDATWSKPDFTCITCGDPLIVINAMVDAGSNLIGSIRTYTCMAGYRVKGKTNIVCQADAHWSPVEFVCDACPEPPLVQNAVIEPGSYLIGSVRQYVCEKGYLSSGPTAVECLADAIWSSPKFACIVCGDTPVVPHSMILPGPHLIGTTRSYECEKGYIPVGPTNILCRTDATWSPTEFQCVACMDPPVVPNAVVDVGSNLIGALRNYQCVKGFLAKGKTSIVCQSDATWSPPEFICDVCGETPVIPNAFVTKGDHFIGSVRVYQCEKGFVATGPTEIICLEVGLWSKPTIQCIACQDPPLVQHALLEPGSNLIGSHRNYICEQGFVATGPTAVECLPDATWAPQQFTCIACTDPPLVSNSVVDIGSNLIGSVRTYTCKDGFVAKGKTSIVCQPDAHWSPPEFICDVCPETPIVPYAVIGPGDHFIGSLRVYQCEKGFRATAPTEIVCQKDGTWSQPAFQCVACPEPPLIKNALIQPGSNLIGSVRQYVCEDGFLASGPTAIECSPDGGWTLPQFSCIVCGDTPLIPNAKIRPGPYLIGTVRTYDCVEGYKASGPTDILCLKDAMWSKPDFTCIACGDPAIVKNAMVDAGFNLIGSIRIYTCTEGYRAKGKTNIVCQADAHWSPIEFVCDACPEPPLVQNAVVEPGSFLIGSVRQYICEKGYLASGPTAVECLADAAWSSPKFSCIVCGDTPLVTNAMIRPGSHLIDTLRTYDCVEGYVAAGPRDILCQKNAIWSPPEFVCIACEDPPTVPNALVDAGSNLIGSLRTYTCRDGYLAKGKTSLICQPDAHWSPTEFMCDLCGGVPLVPHALALPGPHLIGTVRNYECEKGYVATGPTDILCTKEALWSPPTFECKMCADPPIVDNAVVRSGLNFIGSVRTYICNLGYLANGDTSIFCQNDATWSKPRFICDVCGPIPDVPNAIPSPGDHQIGSVIFYECIRGFIPDAPTDILCTNNATWSSPLFSCKTCSEPPPVKHALVNPGLVLIGSERQYVCDLGYLAKGDTVIVCQTDATWSKTMFYCDVCGEVPIVKNAEILAGPHLIGSVRQYRCMDGLLATGPTEIICQKDATWSAATFQCISCGEVPLIENAVILSGSHLIGSIRKYECVNGFISSSSTEIMCQKDATWSVPKFVCIACSKPPLVKNAVINPGENLVGSTRMYTCEEGYFAKGNTEITCLPDATWSVPTFVCDVCGPEPSVDNAVILPGSNLVGSFRLYQCAKGLIPSGSTKIVCQADGTWSMPMFNCIGCGIPPLVQNAVVSPGESLIGEFRTYTCNEGLIPTGPAGIVCLDNATWTAAEFTCVECRSLVDMIVVVDGSDSINAPGYEMLRGAIIKLIPELEMGNEKARVGIVVFSSNIHEVIPLTGNSTSLISKVKYLHHPRDGTNTAKGIQKMREMFQSNGRQDVPWLGIVITDGISKQPLQTKQEAESAKAEGVYMIAVGVTDKINQAELQDISSSPKQVLQLETFGQLSKELVNLMRNVCRKKTPSLLHSILEVKRE